MLLVCVCVNIPSFISIYSTVIALLLLVLFIYINCAFYYQKVYDIWTPLPLSLLFRSACAVLTSLALCFWYIYSCDFDDNALQVACSKGALDEVQAFLAVRSYDINKQNYVSASGGKLRHRVLHITYKYQNIIIIYLCCQWAANYRAVTANFQIFAIIIFTSLHLGSVCSVMYIMQYFGVHFGAVKTKYTISSSANNKSYWMFVYHMSISSFRL